MDHTYQRPLQLPAGYALLSEEEMTYTEGGAFSIEITPEQVVAFGVNVAVNLFNVMGRYAFQTAVSGVQTGLNDGLSLVGIADHFWGKMNTWSRVLTVGLGVSAGIYVYGQAVSMYRSIMNLVNSFRETFDSIQQQQQQEQLAQQSTMALA